MKNSLIVSTTMLNILFLTSIQAQQAVRPGQVAKVQEKIEKLQKTLDKIKNTKIVLNKELMDAIKTFRDDIKNLDYEVIGLNDKDFNDLKKSIIAKNKVSTPLFNILIAGSGMPTNPHFIFANATSATADLLKQLDPNSKNKISVSDVVQQLGQIISRLGDDPTSFSNKNSK